MALALFNPIATVSTVSYIGGLTATLCGIASALGSLASANTNTLPPCIPPDCYKISENSLHDREITLLKGFRPSLYECVFDVMQQISPFEGSPEYLRLRKDDPREKMLFLSGSCDRSDFLNPSGFLNPKRVSRNLYDVNNKFDLKYKVVKSIEQICEEVDLASKIGKLTNVIIHANGNDQSIFLSETCKPMDCILGKENLLNCFKGLDPNGKITLLAPFSGQITKDQKNNIAQRMASAAKRTVVASTDTIYTARLKVSEPNNFEIYQNPTGLTNYFRWIVGFDSMRSDNNHFKIFNPIYENCVNIFKDKIHAREQSAIDVVKKASDSKSILIQPNEFEDLQDLLRLCKDDPRQKFLYLSMEADHNGGLEPKYVSQILEPLSKEYDLRFKLIKSYDELCSEIKEATKLGQLTNIVIDGHGVPEGTHISGNSDVNNYISIYRKDLAKCFQGADLSKITLFSCSTAAPFNGDPKNNIAHKIADDTKKTVIAPLESISGTNTKLTSINPFEVTHPSQCDKKGNCKSDVNTFQTIEPKKKP